MQTYRRKSHTSQGTLYGNSTLTSSYIKHIKKSIKSSSITPMGQGGFGSIYHIVLPNKSEVAVKFISRKLNESWKSFKQRVKNEYLCQWVCTGQANVVGAVKLMFGGRFKRTRSYIVMEYVPFSQTLEERMLGPSSDDGDPLPFYICLYYFKQMLLGLEHIHSHSILHGDIKPANILIDHEDKIKICDFGSAVDMGVKKCDHKSSKSDFSIVTAYWSAPELNTVCYQPTVKTDVYSLAIVLLTMIHGYAKMDSWSSDFTTPSHPALQNIGDPRIQATIQQMLSVNPLDRPFVFQILETDWMRLVSDKKNSSISSGKSTLYSGDEETPPLIAPRPRFLPFTRTRSFEQ